jgi:hypothetical protein
MMGDTCNKFDPHVQVFTIVKVQYQLGSYKMDLVHMLCGIA